jgi:hypothetical protein
VLLLPSFITNEPATDVDPDETGSVVLTVVPLSTRVEFVISPPVPLYLGTVFVTGAAVVIANWSPAAPASAIVYVLDAEGAVALMVVVFVVPNTSWLVVLVAVTVVKRPVLATVPPIAGGLAR